MSSLIEGIILGLTLAFFFGFGPAFFALIQTGIHRGFFKGFLLAIGVFLNDLFVVTVSIFGAHTIMSNVQSHQWLGIVGGVILIVVGIVTYRHKTEIDAESSEVVPKNEPHFMVYITKGFLLNIANPFVWLFWPTVVLGVAAPFMDTTRDIVLFFTGTLSVVFLSDITKVYLASKIKRFITNKFLMKINAIAGIALVIFGIVLIIRSLTVSNILF
jgi:threonine/homoserine/homoserine lactone efflux protein